MGMYAIGDRVEAVIDYPSENRCIFAGDIGTVCDLSLAECEEYPEIGVAWDKQVVDGHDCGGTCEFGHGWYAVLDEISPYAEEAMEDINETSFLKIVFQEC